MRYSRVPASCILAACLTLAPTAAASATHRRVPEGFLGVTVDGELLTPNASDGRSQAEFDQMVGTGVEGIRVAVYWSAIQPYAFPSEVPPGDVGRFQLIDGIATDFSSSDRVYELAASHHIRLLPVIVGAPPWARTDPLRAWSPPADPQEFGNFVGLLVRRYGPGGLFWAQHPELPAQPTREWQIWNEPAGGYAPNAASVFWADPVPFQDPYLAMVSAARSAIKSIDPQGELVLAGLFEKSWLALDSIYQHGGRGLFDAVAINIFTVFPADVIRAVENVKAVMTRHGDGALPILVSEFSWPSAVGHVPPQDSFGYAVTPAQQARNVAIELRLLAAWRARLNIERAFWLSWASRDAAPDDSFDYTGLRHIQGAGQIVPKPAQGAFRDVAARLEGCVKAAVATSCRHRKRVRPARRRPKVPARGHRPARSVAVGHVPVPASRS